MASRLVHAKQRIFYNTSKKCKDATIISEPQHPFIKLKIREELEIVSVSLSQHDFAHLAPRLPGLSGRPCKPEPCCWDVANVAGSHRYRSLRLTEWGGRQYRRDCVASHVAFISFTLTVWTKKNVRRRKGRRKETNFGGEKKQKEVGIPQIRRWRKWRGGGGRFISKDTPVVPRVPGDRPGGGGLCGRWGGGNMRKLCGEMREKAEIMRKLCGHFLRQKDSGKFWPQRGKEVCQKISAAIILEKEKQHLLQFRN